MMISNDVSNDNVSHEEYMKRWAHYISDSRDVVKWRGAEALYAEIGNGGGKKENKKDNKDPVIKMCGQAISKPIAQISSSIDPLKPSDYFHIISRSHQTICILDSKGKEDKYALTEGQKLTYRGGQPPFKLVIDPVVTDIFYEGWLVKLKPEQNYIQLNPKTYN